MSHPNAPISHLALENSASPWKNSESLQVYSPQNTPKDKEVARQWAEAIKELQDKWQEVESKLMRLNSQCPRKTKTSIAKTKKIRKKNFQH